ncbi:small cysteine and glycine repeat-containing protein 3-like [Saccostrea cucullata]|uniref:small cysteine and glycine repeat-containing protein 3-like n=1 Tax=Saccostrea cuccullata TaxID=36930 RepID=UPI002ED0335A
MADIDCGSCDCGSCDCGDCGDCGDCSNCDCGDCECGDCCGICGDNWDCHCCDDNAHSGHCCPCLFGCTHCCSCECCVDSTEAGHHCATHWWLCFASESCDCCYKDRRGQDPQVYTVDGGGLPVTNGTPAIIPSKDITPQVVMTQPPSYEEAVSGSQAVTSQPT